MARPSESPRGYYTGPPGLLHRPVGPSDRGGLVVEPAACGICDRPIYFDRVERVTASRWHHARTPELGCAEIAAEPGLLEDHRHPLMRRDAALATIDLAVGSGSAPLPVAAVADLPPAVFDSAILGGASLRRSGDRSDATDELVSLIDAELPGRFDDPSHVAVMNRLAEFFGVNEDPFPETFDARGDAHHFGSDA